MDFLINCYIHIYSIGYVFCNYASSCRTISKRVRISLSFFLRLFTRYLRRPVNVIVGVVGQVVDRIEQRVEMISDEGAKLNRIQKIFAAGEFDSPMIVFVNQKKGCDAVAKVLEQRGVKLICIVC